MNKGCFAIVCILGLVISQPGMAHEKYETVADQMIGPGMRYCKLIERSTPLSIDILEVDLTDPYLAIESCKGHEILRRWDLSLGSRETTSSMVRRNHGENRRVAGAINGDFFNTAKYAGEPVGFQVSRGVPLNLPIGWSTVAFTPDHKPLLERFSFDGRVLHRGSIARIDRINASRENDLLVLYNSFFADSTRTNAGGAEALLTPVTPWMMNDTVDCIVDKVELNIGNLPIPDNKVVLSGHGMTIPFIAAMQPGDTVRLVLRLPQTPARVKEIIGGSPRIVHNGVNTALEDNQAEGRPSSFATNLHPRTAVGFSEDSTKLIMVVVDGRQPELSAGINLIDLADLLLNLGCHNAINLDGGGSSTMVIRDKVVNSPSDGWERSVANALLFISTAPKREVIRLELKPGALRILEGESQTFSMAGLDTFINTITANPADFSITMKPGLGVITPEGCFTAGSSRDSGYVHFSYQQVRDSVFVAVKTLEKLEILPDVAVIDTSGTVQFTIEALDSDGTHPHPNVTWENTNPQVGTLDATGLFTPAGIGETQIIIRAAGLADTARVRVSVCSGSRLVVERPDRFTLWQNYPNPFNQTTRIELFNDARQPVRLIIFDLLGREVVRLFDGSLDQGSHEFRLKAGGLATGVYFLRSEPAVSEQIMMTLMR